MPQQFHSFCRFRSPSRQSERGYILLMLMLFVALLAIGAGALAPSIAFRVRRDREEEMIHRGVQYSRAIRRYVKKTGRYPSRIEELENTNNLRFLRKRYKDPITGQDFKLLHVGEVQLMGAGLAGAAALGGSAVPGASPLGAATLSASSPNPSTPGAAAGMLLGGTQSPAPGAVAATTAATGAADSSSEDPSQMNPGAPDRSKTDPSKTDQSKTDPSQSDSATEKLSSKTFGGGPIVGVASVSKAQSIREFNHKNHYDQWQFIYDPIMDRGGLITTPAQPPLQVAAPILQQNSSGQNASGTSGFSGGPQAPPPVQPTQQQ
jgi:type II secretory pathway pseudopilin PulG